MLNLREQHLSHLEREHKTIEAILLKVIENNIITREDVNQI